MRVVGAGASDRETLAALGAATGQHQAAALGGHARTEAVGSLAMQVARLICALHVRLRSSRNLDQKQSDALVGKGPARTRRRGLSVNRTGAPGVCAVRDIHRLVSGIHSRPLPRSAAPTAHRQGPFPVEISLWNHCLRRLEAELPEQHFNTWIRPLQAIEDIGQLRLLAPNRYVVDWVNQNCASRIGELVEELVPAPTPQVIVEIGTPNSFAAALILSSTSVMLRA